MRRVAVLAWGNPSRGDDAIGPRFIEALAAQASVRPEWAAHAFVTDFQLQPEHALDLDGADLVLFADASASAAAPFTFARVRAARDQGFTTHGLGPHALLAVHGDIAGGPTPPAWLLAIRGQVFELGAPLGAQAEKGLEEAVAFATRLLSDPDPELWDRATQGA